MAEWTKATVLKTVDPQGSVGSNPTRSADGRSHADRAARGRPRRARSRPTTPSPALRRLPWADLGFARVDHHRAAAPGHGRGRLRAGQDGRARGRPSSASCSTGGDGPVLVTRADRRPGRRRPRRPPRRRQAARHAPSCGGRRPPRPERVVARLRRHRRPPRGRRVRRRARRLRRRRRRGSPTSASPASTASSAHVDDLAGADAVVVVAGMEGALASHRRRASRRPRSSPCPTSAGYGSSLEGRHRPPRHARLLRRRHHRRRHRQRLRRRLRRAPAAQVTR